MLSLGSSLSRPSISKKSIVKDNLLLRHDYTNHGVHQVSTGAANINADGAASEYINVGAITIGTGDISVSAWFYVTDWVNYAGIFTNREDGGTQPGIEIRARTDSGNRIECIIDDGGSSESSTSGALNTHQWYHVCAVWDRSDKQFLYIDGVLVDSDSITTENVTCNHSDPALIGKRTYNSASAVSYFRGYICNVGYWNRVLTQAEIKSIMWKNYASLTSDETSTLASWWNLDSAVSNSNGGITYDNNNTTLGSEELSNTDFSSDSVWAKGTGWSIANGKATHAAGTSADYLNQTGVIVSGSIYEVTFTVSGDLDGSNFVQLYSDSGVYPNDEGVSGTYTSAGTYTTTFISNDTNFKFRAVSPDVDISISDVSVKLVNGNPGKLL